MPIFILYLIDLDARHHQFLFLFPCFSFLSFGLDLQLLGEELFDGLYVGFIAAYQGEIK